MFNWYYTYYEVHVVCVTCFFFFITASIIGMTNVNTFFFYMKQIANCFNYLLSYIICVFKIRFVLTTSYTIHYGIEYIHTIHVVLQFNRDVWPKIERGILIFPRPSRKCVSCILKRICNIFSSPPIC